MSVAKAWALWMWCSWDHKWYWRGCYKLRKRAKAEGSLIKKMRNSIFTCTAIVRII